MNPIASATAGLLNASARFDTASQNLVKAANGAGPTSLTSAVTDQVSAKLQFEATAGVVKVLDETAKRALDILV